MTASLWYSGQKHAAGDLFAFSWWRTGSSNSLQPCLRCGIRKEITNDCDCKWRDCDEVHVLVVLY
jgi:hypothetical protein